MKLYRMVGQEEVKALLNGETLVNETDWSEIYDTNSKGFCFFAYNRSKDIRKVLSAALEDWLNGIVTADYIVEVELDNVKKSFGYYSCGCRAEYNTTSYSIENVKSIHKVVKLNPADWLAVGDYIYRFGAEKIY